MAIFIGRQHGRKLGKAEVRRRDRVVRNNFSGTSSYGNNFGNNGNIMMTNIPPTVVTQQHQQQPNNSIPTAPSSIAYQNQNDNNIPVAQAVVIS